MDKKKVLFGGLLASLLLVGCANNDKPSTNSTVSSDTTTSETSKDSSTVKVVNPTAIEIVGDNFVAMKNTLKLLPKFLPADTTEKGVTWTSSDETKAKVDSNGVVTPVAPGDVVITATSTADTSVKVEHNVKVVLPPSKIEITAGKHLNVLNGKTAQLEFTVTGKEGFNNEVEFVVKDSTVLEISETGLITSKKLGETDVTVKSKYAEVSDTITIHISQVPDSIHLFANDDWDARTAITEAQALNVAQVIEYGVSYNGEAAFYGVTAESNNEKVATVTTVGSNKIKVTAVAVGSATITVKSVVDETKVTTLTVNVAAPEIVYPVEGLKIDFGTDVAPGKHSDNGARITGAGSFEAGEYTIPVTEATNVYVGVNDAQGNKALKLGKSDETGTFKMTVEDKVNQVVIMASNYKGRASTLKVNDQEYTFTKSTDDGQYEEIVIDTSKTKTLVISSVVTKYGSKKNNVVFVDSITLKTQPIVIE